MPEEKQSKGRGDLIIQMLHCAAVVNFADLQETVEELHLKSCYHGLSLSCLLLCLAKRLVGDMQLLLQVFYHPQELLYFGIFTCGGTPSGNFWRRKGWDGLRVDHCLRKAMHDLSLIVASAASDPSPFLM